MFVFKLCLWRKTPARCEDYFLSGCCLGDLAVISAKLNDLETQMRSQRTAKKNQLNGRGCGKAGNVHTHTLRHISIHPKTFMNAHTQFANIKTRRFTSTTSHTLPEQYRLFFGGKCLHLFRRCSREKREKTMDLLILQTVV